MRRPQPLKNLTNNISRQYFHMARSMSAAFRNKISAPATEQSPNLPARHFERHIFDNNGSRNRQCVPLN